MIEPLPALVVVDMQKYYLEAGSPYCRYFNSLQPGCLDYITERCRTTVIPNIQKLIRHFRERSLPVIFLRLCGKEPDRKDLAVANNLASCGIQRNPENSRSQGSSSTKGTRIFRSQVLCSPKMTVYEPLSRRPTRGLVPDSLRRRNRL